MLPRYGVSAGHGSPPPELQISRGGLLGLTPAHSGRGIASATVLHQSQTYVVGTNLLRVNLIQAVQQTVPQVPRLVAHAKPVVSSPPGATSGSVSTTQSRGTRRGGEVGSYSSTILAACWRSLGMSTWWGGAAGPPSGGAGKRTTRSQNCRPISSSSGQDTVSSSRRAVSFW